MKTLTAAATAVAEPGLREVVAELESALASAQPTDERTAQAGVGLARMTPSVAEARAEGSVGVVRSVVALEADRPGLP